MAALRYSSSQQGSTTHAVMCLLTTHSDMCLLNGLRLGGWRNKTIWN